MTKSHGRQPASQASVSSEASFTIACRIRLALDGGQLRSALGDEPLGEREVVLVVDVEPLEPLGQVRREHAPLSRPGRLDDARPRDLERAVLDVDARQRLVLAGMPGDVEVRLVEERPHQPAELVQHPHLPGVLLDELDGPDRVGLGRREQLLEAAADHVRAAERVRRAHDREEVVVLLEPRQRPGDPLDVRRGRGRVLVRAQERHVGAVPACDLARSPRRRWRRRSGRRPRTAAPSRSRTRAAGAPRGSRTFFPGTRSEPLRAPISATAGLAATPDAGLPATGDVIRGRRPGIVQEQRERRRRDAAAPSGTDDGAGDRVELRRVGPPTASRAVEVVRSSGKASMIAHCRSRIELDPLGDGDGARPRRARPPFACASPRPREARPGARRDATVAADEHGEPRGLLPEHGRARRAGRRPRSRARGAARATPRARHGRCRATPR